MCMEKSAKKEETKKVVTWADGPVRSRSACLPALPPAHPSSAAAPLRIAAAIHAVAASERGRHSTLNEQGRDGWRRARTGGVLFPAPGAPPRPPLCRQRVGGGGATPGARGEPPPGSRSRGGPGFLPVPAPAPAVRLLHQPRRRLLLLLLRRRHQSDLVPQAQEPSLMLRSASWPASACLRYGRCPNPLPRLLFLFPPIMVD